MLTIYDLLGFTLDESRREPKAATYRSSTPGRTRDGHRVTVYDCGITDEVAVHGRNLAWPERVRVTRDLAEQLGALPGLMATVFVAEGPDARKRRNGPALVEVRRTR